MRGSAHLGETPAAPAHSRRCEETPFTAGRWCTFFSSLLTAAGVKRRRSQQRTERAAAPLWQLRREGVAMRAPVHSCRCEETPFTAPARRRHLAAPAPCPSPPCPLPSQPCRRRRNLFLRQPISSAPTTHQQRPLPHCVPPPPCPPPPRMPNLPTTSSGGLATRYAVGDAINTTSPGAASSGNRRGADCLAPRPLPRIR